MDESINTELIESFRKNGELDEYMKYSIKEDDIELELVYGDLKDNKVLSKQQFLNLKKHLEMDTKYLNLGQEDTLDIRTELRRGAKSVASSMRLTIEGLEQIKNYCKTDMIEPLRYTIVNKLRYKDLKNPSKKFNSIHSAEYPCRINLKHEIPHTNTKESNLFIKDWQKKNKSFRYKKRFSFLSVNKIWRIDLTAIKQTKNNEYFKTFKQSRLLAQKEIFELEIEYVGNSDIKSPFSPPPIVDYAKLSNEIITPFGTFDFNESDMGTFYDSTSVSLSEGMSDLYLSEPSSPTYDIEYDEPSYYPTFTPKPLPDTVTIKPEYWKDNDMEHIWKHIKKGYEPEEWVHKTYKFIPRKKEYRKDNTYIIVEISPHLSIEDDTDGVIELSTLDVTSEYILEDLEGVTIDTEYTDELSGGGIPSSKIKKGGGLYDATIYSQSVINNLLNDLSEIIMKCFEIIYESPYFLTKSMENEIRKHYCKMTNQPYGPRWNFIGPQPVSMAIEHLNPYNPNAIMSGYAVTEKADGVRAELLIKDGHGYLITPKKQIIDTGTKFNTTDDWVFDGEYITQNKKGENIRLYMIFDVYYTSQSPGEGNQPHTYPWFSKKDTSRSKIIHEFKNSVDIQSETNSMRIGYKQYYEGPDKLIEKDGKFKNLSSLLKYSKKILDKEETLGGFEYFTDGLIFLPMFLPVKATTEKEKVKSIKGTWSLNYKWKPPEENTIDFKVIYKKDNTDIYTYTHTTDTGIQELRKYQKVQLAVGYKEKDDNTLDFNWALLTDKPSNKRNFQYFDPPEFKVDNIHLSNIPLQGDKMICCKDNKSIEPGMIVEMRYDPKATNGYHWIPLRVRDDKDRPQYFTIANNIWKTINNPITPNMIKGVINFEELEGSLPQSQDYYVDSYDTEDSPIRDLHNYIKGKLISRIGSSPQFKGKLMIADLSCGRGGDIKKYLSIKNDIAFILGLDISSNVNEAAQRYYYLQNPKPKALFLQFDTSKSVHQKLGCLGDTPETIEKCENLLDIIFHKSKSVSKEYKHIQKSLGGIAKQGFDIVSSQFSVHYYFKNEETLRGFCENVRDLCSSGGYFIGTCYDGKKVFDMFSSLKKETVDMKDSHGSLIYQIKKLYDIKSFDYEKDSLSSKEVMDSMLGNEIEVFMSSIGQPIIEYLVHFGFFVDIMKEYGFELSELPTFRKGEFNPIKNPIEKFDIFISNMDEIKEKDNEFITKTKKTDLYKVTPISEYEVLSGLNNLFVFKKI